MSPIEAAAHARRLVTLAQLSRLGAPVVLVTRDGSRHTGHVTAQDITHVRIHNLTGDTVIDHADITDVGTYND
ncbi:hypothetical protein [Polymorphospora rubra]|uniref:Uncharacterized protein n=1 Tax=Polymorphospora rubra TaxID=338584 RepID=A0A810MZW5_9ACTN|nr:hypothetical protein [Polymorphospora rubra]BCJ65093.1 hypothetical protein Prubr_21140 [Polymorphospora rubra]